MSQQDVWHEFKFQARLRYLAFKRCVWLIELLVLLILALVVQLVRVPHPYSSVLLLLQAMRVIGEAWNHYHLAEGFNARDRWTWFPFVGS